MTDETERGCEVCRAAVYGLRWEEALDRIAVAPQGPGFLHRCRTCFTDWDFDTRKAAAISDEEARRLYPRAFAP
jgi:hypothetical protein